MSRITLQDARDVSNTVAVTSFIGLDTPYIDTTCIFLVVEWTYFDRFFVGGMRTMKETARAHIELNRDTKYAHQLHAQQVLAP
jgi:hypothetical protein